MKIHHLGIAVNSIEKALTVYRQLFPDLKAEREPLREGASMEMVMIKTESGPLLELMQPLHPDGDIGRFIARRGEGIHHIAYEAADIHAVCAQCREQGYRVLGEITQGAGGCDTFFIHPKDTCGVLTEFVSCAGEAQGK